MAGALAQATYSLEGVNCAGCIGKIERTLSATPGIAKVRGNATQRRLFVEWQPDLTNEAVIAAAVAALGYKAHEFHPEAKSKAEAALVWRLALAFFVTMNIMVLSIAVWLGVVTDMGAGTQAVFHWLSAALAVPVVLYSGSVFYKPALAGLRHGNMTMDLPITIAIFTTFAASIIGTLRHSEQVYFDAVVALIFLLLIGRYLDAKLRRKSGQAAENLRAMLQMRAEVFAQDGTVRSLPAEQLRPGDIVRVQIGETLPADGVLLSQSALLNKSAHNGEALASRMAQGDEVLAGMVAESGPLRVEVTRAGTASVIGQMARIAEEAAAYKGRSQLLADRFALAYVPTVIVGSALGFAIWYFLLGAGFGTALEIAIAVLVVTCPCAAGLATPAVASRAVELLLRRGVLMKNGAALEGLAEINRIFADKTGTLTTARLAAEIPALYRDEIEALAAASQHPLAKALIGQRRVAPATEVEEIRGQGLRTHGGAILGSAAFVGAHSDYAGAELWYRSVTGECVHIKFIDEPRTGLDQFLDAARQSQIPTSLLSGDRQGAVDVFAADHGIEDARGQLTPTAKYEIIKNEGAQALMMGDGINDSLALSAAKVSLSFASASKIAQNAADILILDQDLGTVVMARQAAINARRLIHQNLRFATIYNFVTVPLALVGLLNPFIAAILMSSSSIVVMLNGLRLRVQP